MQLLQFKKRLTTRHLTLDDDMKLVGRNYEHTDEKNLYGFNGIHIISNRIFKKGLEIKFQGILEIYMDVIADKKEFVTGYDAGKSYFKDLGKLKNLFS